jgi:hypothetical protein
MPAIVRVPHPRGHGGANVGIMKDPIKKTTRNGKLEDGE